MDKLFLLLIVAAIIGFIFYKNPIDLFNKPETYNLLYIKSDNCLGDCRITEKHSTIESCKNNAVAIYNERKSDVVADHRSDIASCYYECPLIFDPDLCNNRIDIDLTLY